MDKKGGGPSRSVPGLAKGLAENGIDVTLMTCESDDLNTHLLDGTNVKLIVVSRHISEKKLEKIVIENKFDLIHNQCIWVPVYNKLCKIARKHHIAYAISPRGTLEPWCFNSQDIVKRYKKKIAMLVYQRTDLQNASILFATADMEANNIRNLGLKPPIEVVPNCIEINDYPCRNSDAVSSCKKQVLFLSRIVSKKGIDILIDAWVKVKANYPDWNLVIAGNGSSNYIDSLNGQIKKLDLEECIKILPPVFDEDKYKLYVESSLFVLPSHSENFGMVIAEAMSCGLPVITTMGTPWQLLEETRTGWWIDLSQKNLENALLSALSSPKKDLFKMGQRGSEIVRKMFSYQEVTKKMVDAYSCAIKTSNKPPFIKI